MTGLRLPAIVFGAVVVVASVAGLRQPGRAADQNSLSPAQIALFESDHLARIRRPATLDYAFRHDGPGSYDDSVSLAVRAVHGDGAKDVLVEFLSGVRRVEFPPVAAFHGNPLIMYFLEWDVLGMHKATGGSALYFRNRIRDAFVDRAQISKVSITIDGRAQPATAIVLQPYRDDPEIERYASFRDKSYRFVLSDSVPGMVYEIRASLPGVAGGAPASADRVTYTGMRK